MLSQNCLGLGATASLSERLLYSIGEKSSWSLSRIWSHDRQSEGFQSLIENLKRSITNGLTYIAKSLGGLILLFFSFSE